MNLNNKRGGIWQISTHINKTLRCVCNPSRSNKSSLKSQACAWLPAEVSHMFPAWLNHLTIPLSFILSMPEWPSLNTNQSKSVICLRLDIQSHAWLSVRTRTPAYVIFAGRSICFTHAARNSRGIGGGGKQNLIQSLSNLPYVLLLRGKCIA